MPKTLPPYLSIIPPDGIVGEGEGRHKRFLSYLPLPPVPNLLISTVGAWGRDRGEGIGGKGWEPRYRHPSPSHPLPSIRYFSRLGGPYLMIISSGRGAAPAYSSTAHPTPPDRPPYCSLRTGGREGRSGG